MIELKPCPFCGGEAKCEQMMIKYRIHCNSDCTGYRSNKNNAISAWNARENDWKYKELLEFVKDMTRTGMKVCESAHVTARKLLREIGESE